MPGSREELHASQLALVEAAMQQGLAQNREMFGQEGVVWNGVGEVDELVVAMTAPAKRVEEVEANLRELLGLGEETNVRVISAACNSAAMGFDEMISEAEAGRKYMVVAVETMTALREPVVGVPEWDGVTDQASLMFFSDAVTVVTGVTGTLRKVFGVRHAERDVNAVLAAINTGGLSGQLTRWGEDDGSGMLHRVGRNLTVKLHDKGEFGGGMMRMNPLGTTKFFSKFTKNMLAKFMEEMQSLGWGEDLNQVFKVVLSHRPSQQLYERKMAKPMGFGPDKMSWDRSMGNSPCAIFGFEMVAKLAQVRGGDRVLAFFFGAGATGEIMALEAVPLTRVIG